MSRGQHRPRYRRNRERQKDTAKASCRCFSLRSRLDARKKYRCRKLSHSGSQIHRCHDLSAERRRRRIGRPCHQRWDDRTVCQTHKENPKIERP